MNEIAIRPDKQHTTRNVYPTERDIRTLSWIGEQYGVRVDHLQRLLGRTQTEDGYVEKAVSLRTAEGIIARWKKLGLVETQKFVYKEPYWVWLSRHGLTFLGNPYAYLESRYYPKSYAQTRSQ